LEITELNKFMQTTKVSIFDRDLWRGFWSIAYPYWVSGDKTRARALLAALTLLLLATTALSVIISYAVRDFMTALSEKDVQAFGNSMLIGLIVFIIATPISTLFEYTRRLLGVYWRKWLTEKFLTDYFSNRAYFKISHNADIDNPDQRISQDVSSFTSTSLDFLTEILSSIIQLIVFIGVLWSISRLLVFLLVCYAVIGTIVVVLFGKKLINLNFLQLKREADLRYGLVHVRNNAESIAFFGGEKLEGLQIRNRLTQAIDNFLNLIAWQRNLAYFTFGYQYLIQILPLVVMAPLYFEDQIKFGVVTQAGGVFATVLASLTLIVSRIESLSQFAAGISRLQTFKTALNQDVSNATHPEDIGASTSSNSLPQITLLESPKLALENVTLYTPKRERALLVDASLEVSPGGGLIILGPSGSGKSSILRAFSGLWTTGEGRIYRPPLSEIIFLPQRPYMILGTLRDQLQYPALDRQNSEEELHAVLKTVNLENLPDRVGGLDTVRPWIEYLSLGEQQRLAFARLLLMKSRFAMLDESTSALDDENEARLYEILKRTGTTFVSVGHRKNLIQYHESTLELHGDGHWSLRATQ